MEEEIFVANSKGDGKALGMKINCAATDLHIYVNGVDIAKSVVLEEVHIVVERVPESKGVVLARAIQEHQQTKTGFFFALRYFLGFRDFRWCDLIFINFA